MNKEVSIFNEEKLKNLLPEDSLQNTDKKKVKSQKNLEVKGPIKFLFPFIFNSFK
jgi:hypothetical protein